MMEAMIAERGGTGGAVNRQSGISLLEVLIAGTLLLLVMLGMNAALMSSSLVALKSKDVTYATNMAQQLLETERAQATSVNYYANLPDTYKASMFGVTGTGDAFFNRYMYTRTATPKALMTDRNTNPGNNVVVKLTGPPIANGITAGSRVVLYYPATAASQVVYVLNPNDASNQFQVDDTAPQQGRQGLQNIFPAGTLVLTATKLISIQVSYAATSGSDGAATGRRPLITLSGYVNRPPIGGI